MNELLSKLEDLKKKWIGSSEYVPEDLKDWGAKFITKEHVSYILDECTALLNILNQKGWQGPVALALDDALPNIDSIDNYLTSVVATPEAQKKFDTFLWDLQVILNNLRNASTFSNDKVYNSEIQLSSIISQIERATPTLKDLQEVVSTLQTFQNESKTAQENKTVIAELLGQAQQLSANMSPVEAQVREYLISVEKNSSTISKYTGEVEELQSQYSELYEKIKESNHTLNNILETSINHQDIIKKTIEDASRLGMAGSFKMRKDELLKPMYYWVGLFFVGVIGLFSVGFFEILPLLKRDAIDWIQLVGRATIVAPCIWLSWFSVKQFGHIIRLWEDYSFKYASAMAFEGYKKGAASISSEMEKLLMEVSIINFSSNPLRVFDSKSNYGSPLNELTDESKGFLQHLLSMFTKRKEK